MKTPTPQEERNFLNNIYQPNFSVPNKQKKPAILILHEITGITEHTKRVAKKFADAGFIVAIPDLFENDEIKKVFQNIPDMAEQAKKEGRSNAELNQKINEKLQKILNSESFIDNALKKLDDWIDYVKSLKTVDPDNISAIGFSFGGWYVFKLAQIPNKINRAVIFYGFYDVTEKMIEEIKCPILGFYGQLETNKTEIAKIQELAKKYDKQIEIYMCKHAKHSFFDDTNPERYNKEASDFSWKKTLDFLNYL